MIESPSGEEAQQAIKFFVQSIKYMADRLDARMVPTFWREIVEAHEALANLLHRSTPPR